VLNAVAIGNNGEGLNLGQRERLGVAPFWILPGSAALEMPVPSSGIFMLSWPAAAEVLERSACWAAEQKRCHQDLLAVGVLGSYTASPSSPPCPSGIRCLLAASIQSTQTFVSTRTPAVPSYTARLVRVAKRGSIGRFVAAN
jgi:hypothetical protein